MFPIFELTSYSGHSYIFFLTPASISEAAAVIPNGAKTFFAKRITFINGPANLLKKDPKNPPD